MMRFIVLALVCCSALAAPQDVTAAGGGVTAIADGLTSGNPVVDLSANTNVVSQTVTELVRTVDQIVPTATNLLQQLVTDIQTTNAQQAVRDAIVGINKIIEQIKLAVTALNGLVGSLPAGSELAPVVQSLVSQLTNLQNALTQLIPVLQNFLAGRVTVENVITAINGVVNVAIPAVKNAVDILLNAIVALGAKVGTNLGFSPLLAPFAAPIFRALGLLIQLQNALTGQGAILDTAQSLVNQALAAVNNAQTGLGGVVQSLLGAVQTLLCQNPLTTLQNNLGGIANTLQAAAQTANGANGLDITGLVSKLDSILSTIQPLASVISNPATINRLCSVVTNVLGAVGNLVTGILG